MAIESKSIMKETAIIDDVNRDGALEFKFAGETHQIYRNQVYMVAIKEENTVGIQVGFNPETFKTPKIDYYAFYVVDNSLIQLNVSSFEVQTSDVLKDVKFVNG